MEPINLWMEVLFKVMEPINLWMEVLFKVMEPINLFQCVIKYQTHFTLQTKHDCPLLDGSKHRTFKCVSGAPYGVTLTRWEILFDQTPS
jgi:hypothetical protein